MRRSPSRPTASSSRARRRSSATESRGTGWRPWIGSLRHAPPGPRRPAGARDSQQACAVCAMTQRDGNWPVSPSCVSVACGCVSAALLTFPQPRMRNHKCANRRSVVAASDETPVSQMCCTPTRNNKRHLPRRATRLSVSPRWPARAKTGKTASALRILDLRSTDSTCSSSIATWNDVRFELKHRARMGAT